MKVLFQVPTDGKFHEYCVHCASESVFRSQKMERTVWSCHTCGQEEYRILTIDPKSIWHVDSLTREMLHESVGVFVSNIEDKILLFKRTVFPFAYTIPAGHLDVDETPLQAIQRELLEETTLHAKKSNLLPKN